MGHNYLVYPQKDGGGWQDGSTAGKEALFPGVRKGGIDLSDLSLALPTSPLTTGLTTPLSRARGRERRRGVEKEAHRKRCDPTEHRH